MNILFSLLFLAMAFLGYILLYRKTKDILNPFAVSLFSWLSVAALGVLGLSSLQTPWSVTMYLAVIFFAGTVFLVGYIGFKPVAQVAQAHRFQFNDVYLLFSRIVFIGCFLCSILEWGKQGFILPFFVSGYDKKSLVASIPVIHYGSVFLPFCAMAAFYELLYREGFKRSTVPFLIFEIFWAVFHALFIISSRGTLLLAGMGFVYIFFKAKKPNLKILIPILGALVLAFALLAKVRIHPASQVFHVVEGSPLFSSIYSYSALCFENLNKLVTHGPAWTICTHSLGGIFELFGLDGLITRIPSLTTSFFNATTAGYNYYQDAGLIGMIVFPALIYGGLRFLYQASIKRQEFILLFSVLQKAIWMVFFGDYFTGGRADLLPYLVMTVFVVFLVNGSKFTVKGKLKKVSDLL